LLLAIFERTKTTANTRPKASAGELFDGRIYVLRWRRFVTSAFAAAAAARRRRSRRRRRRSPLRANRGKAFAHERAKNTTSPPGVE
jgi:hypothetical protein